MKALTALIGLCSFFLLVPFVQWVWPYLCDAAFLVAALVGLLFACPWVILGGFAVWALWSNHREEEAKKAAQAEQERRLERQRALIEEQHCWIKETQVAMKQKERKVPVTHAEHPGITGQNRRWN